MVPLSLPSLEHCIPFNCCECTALKYEKNTKTGNFLTFLQPLLGLYKDGMTNFPTQFFILQIVKSQPFHIPEA